MENYCDNLNIFNNFKQAFLNDAFIQYTPICAINIHNACIDATNLHNFSITQVNFINNMKKGCLMDGNATACKIGSSNVSNILEEFNNSYYVYIQYPRYLCVAFSEFTNNLFSLFITGGCYLYNKTINLCGYNC